MRKMLFGLMLATGISACGHKADVTVNDKDVQMDELNDFEVGVTETNSDVSTFLKGGGTRRSVYHVRDSSVITTFHSQNLAHFGGDPRNWGDFTESEKAEFAEVKKFMEQKPE